MIRAFIIAALLVFGVGCNLRDYNARVFDPWGCDNAEELKARHYTNILLVRICEDQWEDRGPNRYSLHHYKGTVVRADKGEWRTSDRIAFVQGLDYRAPPNSASCVVELGFVFTSEHTNEEISLDTGELCQRIRCDYEVKPRKPS